MLVEAFVKFAFDIVRWVLGLIPPITIPTFDFSAAVGLAYSLNGALPVAESVTVVGFFVTLVGALWAFQVIRLLLKHIPLVGG